jgi:hypothetical protein
VGPSRTGARVPKAIPVEHPGGDPPRLSPHAKRVWGPAPEGVRVPKAIPVEHPGGGSGSSEKLSRSSIRVATPPRVSPHAERVWGPAPEGRPAQPASARMRRQASSIRSSGAVSDTRKNPSPPGPKAIPGVTLTAARSSSPAAKARLSPSPGTGAQR